MNDNDRLVVTKLLELVVQRGLVMNVDYGDGPVLDRPTGDAQLLLPELNATGDELLTLHDAHTGDVVGCVRLIYGNGDWELIADNSDSADPLCQEVSDWCFQQERLITRVAVSLWGWDRAQLFDPGVDERRACDLYAADHEYWLNDSGSTTLTVWYCTTDGEPYWSHQRKIS